MIQLLLEDFGYLDLSDETQVPLNFDINDIRILGTRNGAWSKTIKIPGTNHNNDVLGNVFNINIETYEFDPLKKVKCRQIVDGLTVFEGVFQLRKIHKKFTSPTEFSVSYDCHVKNDASSLFAELSGKLLSDLDLSSYDHFFTQQTVIDSFESGNYTKGYQYFLGFNGLEIDYWGRNLIPSVYARTYLDAMMSQAGFSYVFEEADEINFDKLIVPFNGEYYAPAIDRKFLFRAGTNATSTYFMLSAPGNGINPPVLSTFTYAPNFVPLAFPDENNPPFNFYDNSGLWDETLYRYDITGFQGTMDFTLKLRGDIGITPTGPGTTVDLKGLIRLRPNIKFQVKDANGALLLTLLDRDILAGDNAIFDDNITGLTVGSYNPVREFNIEETATFASFMVPNAAYVEVNLSTFVTQQGTFLGSFDGGNNYTTTFSLRTFASENSNDNVLYNAPSSEIAEGTEIFMNTVIPREIKQSEFLLSLAKMFNLYIYQDIYDDKRVIIKTRDKFYSEGQEIDWTDKLDYKSVDVEFLSNTQKKIKKLTYQQDDDALLTAYEEQTREVYAQLRYVFENEHIRDTDEMETAFSPTPTIFANGLYLPYIDSQKPANNIRILQVGGLLKGQWNYVKLGISTLSIITPVKTPYTLYRHAGMLYPDPINPELDISFGTPQYFAYPVSTMTNANLYNRFYRNQLQILERGKIMSAMFNLTAADIANLQFNERVWLLESWWNINRVIDYDAAKRGLTRVELVSADSNLTPFLAGQFSINSSAASQYYGKAAEAPHGKNDYGPGTSNLKIFGKDNLIHAQSGNLIVIGDQNNVSGKNSLVVGSKNSALGDNQIVLGITGQTFDEENRVYMTTPVIVSPVINAGRDTVLDLYPDAKVVNWVSASRDSVRELGSHSIENFIFSGRDSV